MDALTQALQLIDEAQALETQILDALREGDTEQAEQLTFKRQYLIESIPFQAFTDPYPQALSTALVSLQQSHEKLATVTLEIRQEIERQLSQVQKGKAGSRVYQKISDQ